MKSGRSLFKCLFENLQFGQKYLLPKELSVLPSQPYKEYYHGCLYMRFPCDVL